MAKLCVCVFVCEVIPVVFISLLNHFGTQIVPNLHTSFLITPPSVLEHFFASALPSCSGSSCTPLLSPRKSVISLLGLDHFQWKTVHFSEDN